MRRFLAIALACAATLSGARAQTQYWTLDLKEDPSIEIGTFAAVGGLTAKEGVRFTLKENTVNAPIVATVLAEDPKKPIQLQAFKDENSPLFDESTDAGGKVVCTLRTAEEIHFKVTGDAGAVYRLSVWRGPEIILPAPDPTVAMNTVLPAGTDTPTPDATATDATATEPSPAPARAGAPAQTDRNPEPGTLNPERAEGPNTFFLGAILLVLMVIAFLIFRGQQLKSRGPALLAITFTILSLPHPASAQDAENIDLRPGLVDPGQRDPRLAEDAQSRIDEFKKWADALNQVTGETVDFNNPYDLSSLKGRGLGNADLDVAGILQTALHLMEAYEIIDPREKFIQPDYNPKGLPVLPSRAVDDYKLATKEQMIFSELQDKINKAKAHLEKNYVVLKQTELTTSRLEDLADSAGGFSAIAGLYWSTVKANPNDPMNKSKADFYKSYDGGQENGLKFLNDALKEMAEFELRNYKDRNWYLYFALPYYNFMVSRYVRR